MSAAPDIARPPRTRPVDRRMAAAWTRLIVGALAVAVPVAFVLGGTAGSRAAGAAAVRTALASVSASLQAEHRAAGTWPADLIVVGTSVLDDAGHRIATVPQGVHVAYERSVDGARAVVTVTDAGAKAVFDSARTVG